MTENVLNTHTFIERTRKFNRNIYRLLRLQDKRVEISFFLPALLTVFLYTYSAPATVPKSN